MKLTAMRTLWLATVCPIVMLVRCPARAQAVVASLGSEAGP